MLAIGLSACLLSTIQAWYFGYVADGIFQIHAYAGVRFVETLCIGLINVLAPVCVLLGFAKSVYRHTRFVDVLVVVLIAQIPIYLTGTLLMNTFSMAKLSLIHQAVQSGDWQLSGVAPLDLLVPVVGAFLALGMLFFFFYLLVSGMKVAINSKKNYHAIVIVVLILILDACLHFLLPYGRLLS